MLNLDELKIIEIIQEQQIRSFRKKTNSKKNQTEILSFTINTVCNHLFMVESIKDNFNYPVDFLLSKIRQYEFIAFFGNGSDISGTHFELKDSRKFWSLFTFLIKTNQYPSLHLEQIQESVKIYGRLKIPLSGRNYASYCLLVTDLIWSNHRDILLSRHVLRKDVSVDDLIYLFDEEVIDCINAQIDILIYQKDNTINNHSKSMIVYRGFDISKDENVREKRYKKNNLLFQNQESGFGISYSKNKEIAKDFSTQKFGAISNILTNTIDDRVSHASFSLKNSGIKIDDFLNISNRRPYVGKYKLNIKDILVDISNFAEEEVIAFPSSIKLLDYRPSTYS